MWLGEAYTFFRDFAPPFPFLTLGCSWQSGDDMTRIMENASEVSYKVVPGLVFILG